MNLQIANSGSVRGLYAARIAAGEIEADGEQASVIEDLAQLERAAALALRIQSKGATSMARLAAARPC
jgi:hypothetical protein